MEIAIHTCLPAKGNMQVDARGFFIGFLDRRRRLLHGRKATEIAAVAYLNFICHMLILSSIITTLYKNCYFYNPAILFITKTIKL